MEWRRDLSENSRQRSQTEKELLVKTVQLYEFRFEILSFLP